MGTARSAEVLIAEPSKRRYRSKHERRQIVEETLQPGASVAVIARRHDVNANQRVTELMSSEPPPARCYAGVIVVEVGRARIRIEGPVDSDNLRVVLERVGR